MIRVAHVAPYVGAWIETNSVGNSSFDMLSHPMWVRGLKHLCRHMVFQDLIVAPYVGAWIETIRARCT